MSPLNISRLKYTYEHKYTYKHTYEYTYEYVLDEICIKHISYTIDLILKLKIELKSVKKQLH